MPKFIESLTDGLTMRGRVLRAGQRIQVESDRELLSKREQTKRWGKPRYRQITESDFEAAGGTVKDDEAEAAPAEPTAEVEEPAGEFAEFEGLNVEETLEKAAELDEEALGRFIQHEQATENRKGVLQPLGVEPPEDQE